MNYKETMEYLEEMNYLGSVPGLESITELCRRLDNPQDKLKFVHIAGTNGKGSVLAYISTVLKTAGYRVGRYLSPTISSYRERIQVNNVSILARELAEVMSRVREQADVMEKDGLAHPTVFEMETAAGFLYFLEKGCEIVVLECGLGGLLDATNLIQGTLAAVITSVSMDHRNVLGNSLKEIALQKAGIIKPGAVVVSAPQEPEVSEILEQKTKGRLRVADKAHLARVKYGLEKQRFDYTSSAGRFYKGLEISIAGIVQPENAALAVEALEALAEKGFPVEEKQLRSGLIRTRWPGRFEVVSKRPCFVVDGAHNEDGARRLAEGIRFYFTNKKILYIMGVLKDKEYEKIVAETYAYAEQIIVVTPPENPRALPAHELAATVVQYHPHVTEAASMEEAVEMAGLLTEKDWVILAFGSLSYLGALRKIIKERSNRSDKSGKNKRRNQASSGRNR